MFKRHYFTLLLVAIPALFTTVLNLYAYAIPFLAEITIIVLGICLVMLGYRFAYGAYEQQRNASSAMRYLYTGIYGSITIFLAAQLIRLLGAILYALTFITDLNALALQARFVLPSFIGGTVTSLPFTVTASFVLGFAIVLPLILFFAHQKKHSHS